MDNEANYNQVGRAYGLVLDLRECEKLSLRTLTVVQKHVSRMAIKIPSALLYPQGVVRTLAWTMDAVGGGGKSYVYFCDSVDEGLAWLDEWFTKYEGDRTALRGVKYEQSFYKER